MPEEKYSSYKNLAYLVFSAILVVVIYQAFNGFGKSGETQNSEISSNAFFQPNLIENQEKVLSGVVKSVPDSDNVKYLYGLYSEDGKLIAYLSSSKIDFALSDGLNVEVNGEFSFNKKTSYGIIEVVSVKLK